MQACKKGVCGVEFTKNLMMITSYEEMDKERTQWSKKEEIWSKMDRNWKNIGQNWERQISVKITLNQKIDFYLLQADEQRKNALVVCSLDIRTFPNLQLVPREFSAPIRSNRPDESPAKRFWPSLDISRSSVCKMSYISFRGNLCAKGNAKSLRNFEISSWL